MAPQSATMVAPHIMDQSAMPASNAFSGLASESRAVRPGYLFAALSGSTVDGADFIADAVARGAVAVLGRPDLQARVAALGVRFIAAENPRRALALQAAAFFAAQPKTVAAVTGTNGKTSVAVFLRQIWSALGKPAASLGTIGAITPRGAITLRQTTPDPIELHRLLAEIKAEGVEHLALEASSHGLDQFRLDGTRIAAAAFTNLTRDHLDYHESFEAYRASKLRLFSDLVADDGVAVVNADAPDAAFFIEAAMRRQLRVLTVGETGATLKLVSATPKSDGQALVIAFGNCTHGIDLKLAGAFQASNALVAAGLAIGLGEPAERVFAALSEIKGAPGRMERVAVTANGAAIYVDYAHTPDALETVLKALRPHVAGRLHLVFGCGGDRDKGKRPLMGQAAAAFADSAIVTDDNPRSETPAAIRAAVLKGCPQAREIGDRRQAIATAIADLKTGDALIIGGKGHESGQTIGSETRPFSDRDEAIAAAVALGGHATDGPP